MARGRSRQPQFDGRDDLLDGGDATLDLHGSSADEARAMVRRFLGAESRSKRGRVVHIITGKGKGSRNGAVLRPLVAAELRGACARFVTEWGPDVGEGGFKVRLR